MNRNSSWQGWVAIALAGLALFVALNGRMSSGSMAWGSQAQTMPMWSSQQAAPAAPQAADDTTGQSFGRGHHGMRGDGPGMSEMMSQGRGDFRSGPMMSHHSKPGFFNIIGMLFGLAKLVGLGLLVWLLFRIFSQRRNAATPTQTPLTPAGHDPTIE
ncbi:MAG: hypothetical protein HGA65_13020 [Oscillochloris sp.]|nr:hypothetical protein [Oscillochloris sp.]